MIPASRIAATGACIIVGCLAEMDGQTEIVMGKAPEIDPGHRPSFDGVLETPSHVVCVWTVEWEKVLETRVPTTSTRVRVWGNHPTEPDEIIVGVESAT